MQESPAEAEDVDEDNREAEALARDEVEAAAVEQRKKPAPKQAAKDRDREGKQPAARVVSGALDLDAEEGQGTDEAKRGKQPRARPTGRKRKRGGVSQSPAVSAVLTEDGPVEEDLPLEDALDGIPVKKKRRVQTEEHPELRRSALWKEVNQDLTILLPSSCLPEVRRQPALRQAVDMEIALRKGEASEALDELRTHLITANLFRKHIQKTKKREDHAMRTRYKETHINKSENINKAARKYRRAYQALVALGVENDPEFPRLRNEDVKAFAVDKEGKKLGDSKAATKQSWIWQKLGFAGEKDLNENFGTYAESGK